MEILGIDIGGSGIKGAIVDSVSGNLLSERKRIDTPIPATPAAVAGAFCELVDGFKWKGIIGVGFPAIIQAGVVRSAANIDKSWIGTDAVALFSSATGSDVFVTNDADAAGMAEMRFGAGAGHTGVVLVLTVGTGIGAALFTNSHLVPNCEFGHLYYKGDIAEKYISDAARKQKDMSWEKWAVRFNGYLLHLEKLISPELLIIGGGMSKKFDKFSKAIKTRCPVVPAKLLNDAGIAGAAAYAASFISEP